ncbi:MAG: hypothetical protein ABIK92_02540 [Pseudomonadota bacterium]
MKREFPYLLILTTQLIPCNLNANYISAIAKIPVDSFTDFFGLSPKLLSHFQNVSVWSSSRREKISTTGIH